MIGLSATPKRWTPLDAPNVVEWWRADAGISLASGKVAAWTGSKNGRLLLQGTASKQPTFVSGDANTANRPTVRFDNNWQQFLRSNLAVSSWRAPGMTTAWSFYMLLRTTASSGAWNVMCSTNNGSHFYMSARRLSSLGAAQTYTHLSTWTGPAAQLAEIEQAGLGLGQVNYAAVRCTHGGSIRQRTYRMSPGETESTSSAPAMVPADPGAPFTVGGMPEGNTWWGGDCSEILICDADLSDADDARVRTYLRERYALAAA